MARTGRRETLALIDTLFAEPGRFDFFQAVRLLERLAREEAGRSPAGGDRPADREAAQFRALPALRFTAGEVARVERPADGLPPEVAVSFFGLTGPCGVLPQHYTSLVMNRLRAKDRSLRDWLDLFNHRLLSHYYRAWEKHRLPAAFERARLDGKGDDLAGRVLLSLAGVGTRGLRGRLDVPDNLFAYFSGHLAHAPRNAAGLEALLSDYFGLPVKVHEFHGQWLYLDPENRARMPQAGESRGLNARLGVDAVIGRRVWDPQSKFRLRLGPMGYAAFRRFLPDGDAVGPLRQVTRVYVGAELDFDFQPVLEPDAVPWSQLRHAEDARPRLGWNTWVRSHNFGAPVGDAVFPARD